VGINNERLKRAVQENCGRERDPIKFEALLVELNKLLEEEHAPCKSRWREDRSNSEQPRVILEVIQVVGDPEGIGTQVKINERPQGNG